MRTDSVSAHRNPARLIAKQFLHPKSSSSSDEHSLDVIPLDEDQSPRHHYRQMGSYRRERRRIREDERHA